MDTKSIEPEFVFAPRHYLDDRYELFCFTNESTISSIKLKTFLEDNKYHIPSLIDMVCKDYLSIGVTFLTREFLGEIKCDFDIAVPTNITVDNREIYIEAAGKVTKGKFYPIVRYWDYWEKIDQCEKICAAMICETDVCIFTKK